MKQKRDRPARPWILSALAVASLAVLVTGLYWPSTANEFIYDDFQLIVERQRPESWGQILQVFRERHWQSLPYYRPVARFTMDAQKYWHGNEPAPFHAFNALLMGVTACLAFALLRRPVWKIPLSVAALLACLFAVHPAASSTVYPICSGRETLIPAAWILAAMAAHFQPGRAYRVVAFLCVVGAIFSKEQAVVLPVLMGLADWLRLTPSPPGRSLPRWSNRYSPLMAVLVVYFFIRWQLFANTSEHHLALWERPWGPLQSLLYGVQTTVLPTVDFLYEPPWELWFAWPRAAVAAVVFGLVVALYLRAPGEWRGLAFWCAWPFLVAAPTANILQQDAKFAERYVFLAMFGPVAVLGMALGGRWSQLAWRRGGVVALSLAVAVCGAISAQRCGVFRDDRAFLDQWLKVNPNSLQARISAATDEIHRQQFETAREHLTRALQIDPDREEAHRLLSFTLAQLNQLEEAIEHGARSVELHPTVAEARFNYGVVLKLAGRKEAAVAEFREAIRYHPGHARAHVQWARILIDDEKYDEARPLLNVALQIRGDNPSALMLMGRCAADGGDHATALDLINAALTLAPEFVEAHLALAEVHWQRGDRVAAESAIRRALELDPESLEAQRAQQRSSGGHESSSSSGASQ